MTGKKMKGQKIKIKTEKIEGEEEAPGSSRSESRRN